jgi:hypothetical protein
VGWVVGDAAGLAEPQAASAGPNATTPAAATARPSNWRRVSDPNSGDMEILPFIF